MEPEVAAVDKKLADPTPMESEAEVAGIGTLPNVTALIAAVVVALLMVGVVTLFFVRFRPPEEMATVGRPVDEKPADEPTA